MTVQATITSILDQYVTEGDHSRSDYFAAIKALVLQREQAAKEKKLEWQEGLNKVYALLNDEILNNNALPVSPVSFGTSGWRGLLGKDIFVQSIAFVTAAILALYREAAGNTDLRDALGVADFSEMCTRGCVIGFDNRFGGELLALAAMNVLAAQNVRILYAGEATTGILSAAVLEHKAAFSINLTPSHNPLEYGGFKYNAADGGPAAAILTRKITTLAEAIITNGSSPLLPDGLDLTRSLDQLPGLTREDALASWQSLVRKNTSRHGLAYDEILKSFASDKEFFVVVDAVHGASRSYLRRLLGNPPAERFHILRGEEDVTFGGIAPEPSSENMKPVNTLLRQRPEPLKIGAIIDPDGDRIRLSDGKCEISMNQFGAMAYHFLHEVKGKQGMVAKTVASSNLANAIALSLGEKVFEPRVGFKEFKPVIGKALVCFEESDGISLIGHTPEKDAFIGLILAMDMVLTLNKNLGDYLQEIKDSFGNFFPDRDGVVVSQRGEDLLAALTGLERYGPGTSVVIGTEKKTIKDVITIDGRKMIFNDGSWIMIRPSGTEPKVRFYVEGRSRGETGFLVQTAKSMLAEIGLLS